MMWARLSQAMFVPPSQITPRKCTEDSPWSDRLILYDCPLFARKFPSASAPAVQDLLLDCNAQLDILGCEERRRRLQSLRPSSVSVNSTVKGMDPNLLEHILHESLN
jgi:hypothetical protein